MRAYASAARPRVAWWRPQTGDGGRSCVAGRGLGEVQTAELGSKETNACVAQLERRTMSAERGLVGHGIGGREG